MLTWSATVHTTLSTDTQPTIIVTFDDAKYIFNASENTGRAFLESNGNWKKAKALFFTQSNVEKTSGMTGLIMTLADATIDKLALHGPPGLTHIVASTRFYTFRDTIDVKTKEIPWTTPTGPTPQPCFSDTNITVYAIPTLLSPEPLALPPRSDVSSTPTSSSESSSEPVSSSSPNLSPEKRKREPSPISPRKRLNPRPLPPGRMALSEQLLTEVRKKDFDPLTLSGPITDEYRTMIIKAMFPNTKPNSNLDPASRRERKRRSIEGMKAKALGKTLPPKEDDDNSNIDAEVDTYRRPRGSLPNGFNKQLPRFASGLPPSNSTMSYLIVGPRYRGKFNAEKAKELGIVGPDRSRLTKGETITITVTVGEETIERIVRPEDVIGKSEQASAILILDVPSPAHIEPLVSSFKGSHFYQKLLKDDISSSASDDVELKAIYHLCGDDVLENDGYNAFLNDFHPDVHHIVASRDHLPDPVTFTSAAYGQLRLNDLDEKFFPIPKYSITPRKDLKAIPGLPPNVQIMASDLHLGLKPYFPPALDPEVTSADKFHPTASGSEPILLSPSMYKMIRSAKARVHKHLGCDVSSLVDGGSQVGIIPLGTGGSLPNKYRNVLSTLIMIPSWGNILLDSGEGTWGQLARSFGSNAEYDAQQALRDLKCIFISHIHGDHHIGLAHLLAKRKSLSPPPDHPLYIVSIRPVHLYLRELSDVQDLGLFDPSGNGIISVISETLHDRATGRYQNIGMWNVGGNEAWLDFRTSVENANKMCDTLGLEYFRTVDVQHFCRAYGCSFKHKDGWSITFSGDTMPTDKLVRLGMNSTVLIHEATLGDDEADIAQRKAHSTIGQAISIGEKMNAKNILLTHFSAKHPKLPPSIRKDMIEAGPNAKPLIVPAFDLLNLTIGDMWKMPFYVPVLYHNYGEIASPEFDEVNSRSGSPMAESSTVVERVAMTG